MREHIRLVAVCAVAWLQPAHGTAATVAPADSAERQVLESAANDLEQRLLHCGCMYDHPDLDAYLQGVADHLLAADSTAAGAIPVRALRNPDANAFALPNGAIFITTGLLQRLDSEAQVATVLGHEMTHYKRSHAVQELRHERHAAAWSRGLGALFAATFAVLTRNQNMTGLAANLTNKSAELWYMTSVSGYSQDMEREADREGLRRMTAAGYDASEGVVAFERLAAAVHDEGHEATPYFSSHPRLAERIASYQLLIGGEYAGETGPGRRIGRDEYRAHTPGLALDQVEILLAARQPDRASSILTAELGTSETARARYLEGEAVRRRLPTADGETLALTAYERAAALPDPPPEAVRQAAMIHRLRGENADALREFQRYLELAPAADDAPLVRAFLAGQAVSPKSSPLPGDPR